MTTRRVAALALACAISSAYAADGRYPDLPDTADVARALANDPGVVSARLGVPVEEANRQRLRAGTNEFVARGDFARRRVTTGDPTGQFGEWSLSLERQLRLPGKGAIDDTIGARGVEAAQFAYGDAMHEAGRRVLRLWFAWQKECALLPLWEEQSTLARGQLSVVQKRRRQGDAARMELNLAEAALAQAEAGQVQAASRETVARATFQRSFPSIALPAACRILEPMPMQGDFESWRDRVAEHSHQLALARVETRRRDAQAERARADLLPDPTIGVRYSNEFGGAEKVAGAYLSVPLPGGGRSAARDSAEAQRGSARYREQSVARGLEVEVATSVESARTGYATWQKLSAAAEGLRQHADRVNRAYQLGESGLADVLAARRLAVESRSAAIAAQADAQEARYRLLLDAHELWPLDPDHESSH